MPQNQQSGAWGNAFGHETAPKIAAAIGASMTGVASNEAVFEGQHAVIKCAGKSTQSVGVTYWMLKQLDVVIAAFQNGDGLFELYLLSSATYSEQMRDSRSSAGQGRVGLVSKKVFLTLGKRLQVVSLG